MIKSQAIELISKFINQRPGLEYANYGDVKAYRSESARITKDLHHARELLAAVAWRDSITADDLIKASQRAFSGRLELGETIQYTAGQYFPTEYRKAACAVLAAALWDYWRTDAADGDAIRKAARKNLNRAVCRAYFN